MFAPPIPKNEKERLNALLSYKILDSAPEKDFDDIVKLASEICHTPISMITLVDKDRTWFKSKIGIEANFHETTREVSFCAHAINYPNETFVISNTTEDVRFQTHPHVTHDLKVRSYVGVPLVDPNGYALGSLCVVDFEPRNLDEFQILALEKLANQVIKLLELRKKNAQLLENHNTLLNKYKDLEQFASVVSHDLKSPLNNIMMLTKLLQDTNSERLDSDGVEMLDYIYKSSEELKKLVDAILLYYKYDNENVDASEKIRLNEFVEYVIGIVNIKSEYQLILPEINHKLYSNKMALGQILFNLIGNSIKYNDKSEVVITVEFFEENNYNIISVTDNGMGIANENLSKIFNIFENLGKSDRYKQTGTGIGLSTVQKMVQKLQGKIEVDSELTKGTTFRLFLKK